MKKILFAIIGLLLNTLFLNGQSVPLADDCYEINGLYVASLPSRLGNESAENDLLTFAQNKGMNYLLIYSGEAIMNMPNGPAYLAAFIKKARATYGVHEVSMVMETALNVDVYVQYNQNHDEDERLDVFTLEFEFWSSDLDELGYCNYLTEYDGCNRENAFDFFSEQMNLLEQATNTIDVETELYIGWPTASEAIQIGNTIDRVLIHYYREDDINIVNYGIDRLENLALANKKVKIAPIFSSEGTGNTDDLPFMGDWLFSHPVDQAFDSWSTQYANLSNPWKSNLEIMGDVWFVDSRFVQNHSNHITTQPTNKERCLGESTSFTVASSSSNSKYYWFKDGECLSDGTHVTGSTSSTLTLSNISGQDFGVYHCRVISYDPSSPGSFVTRKVTLTDCILQATQSPFNGVAAVIPGVIEAEKYDLGGEGVAYHEAVDDGINEGGSTFRSDGVDIQDINSANYNIGYIATGEWLEYTVNVTSTDVYDIEARVANGGATDAIFHLEIDGNTIGQNGVLGNTGPWSTWTSLSLGRVSLPQGEHIIRLYTDQASFTIDNITFSINQLPTVSVASTSTIYAAPADITLTAAANDADGDIVKVEFYNDETLLGTDQTVPYEYIWSNVDGGTYTVTSRAYDDKNDITNSAPITINVTVPQSPFNGVAAVIPGIIEAEEYDLGGEGVSFHEVINDGVNEGGSTFRSDGVDIQDISAGNYNVGYIATGEWLEYTVNVTSTDVYNIVATVANGGATDAIFHLEIDGNTIGQNGSLGNTGSWSTWVSLSLGEANLPQGEHIIRFFVDQASFTIDNITFSGNQPPIVSVTSNRTTYPAPADITLTAIANDTDGDIVKVEFYNGETLLGTDQTVPYEYIWLSVGEGTYAVTSKAYDDENEITTSASITINVTVQGPYGGVAAVIPGVIEAEEYDVGGEGVAYHEVVDDGVNDGGSTFRSDGVDIQDISTGNYNVGYIATGEWLEYTVNVTSTDVYDIVATVANGGATDAIFHLEIDGNTIGQNGVLGNTGPWSTWTSLSLGQANLPQGEHIIRLYTDQATYTIDDITFSKATITDIGNSITSDVFDIYPNPVEEILRIKSKEVLSGKLRIFDSKGQQVINRDISNKFIDVSGLDTGIYMVEFIYNDKVVVKKFVKE